MTRKKKLYPIFFLFLLLLCGCTRKIEPLKEAQHCSRPIILRDHSRQFKISASSKKSPKKKTTARIELKKITGYGCDYRGGQFKAIADIQVAIAQGPGYKKKEVIHVQPFLMVVDKKGNLLDKTIKPLRITFKPSDYHRIQEVHLESLPIPIKAEKEIASLRFLLGLQLSKEEWQYNQQYFPTKNPTK